MATYTVSSGHVGVEPWTLVASQVDTVTFTDNVPQVRIICDGAAEVRFTLDGTTPTIGAAGASTRGVRLPAAATTMTLELTMPSDSDVLKFISSGTPKVSVERVSL